MPHVNREIDRYRDIQHAILAACHGQETRVGSEGPGTMRWVIFQQGYRRITASMNQDDKVALVHWLGEADIDVVVPADRTALYHAAPGRKYRPTRRERESGRFECPVDHVIMVRVTRKALDPLFRCCDCGFCIAHSDIWTPGQGEEPELREDVSYPEGIVPLPEEEPGPW